ncbi:LacI family DNA-binding transcriptional regulator [Pollutimonas sp. M17]|uniref:LacI family DNA-binding transcriptional regulator n=1 Tax=Pollutimonas sp. M17 TaxID=2962065 RepID=UPI0021F3E175|nr:LacI family DNA-binding transcriptional regulator [Pollutimonas sp. M17]UYO93782.1 LacI family transcriptional regulator [Pollutimonas sp. M17]
MSAPNESVAGIAARPSVTIKDIAKALDLSHTTISRALADHPKISEATKASVRQMARRMGYVANGPARNIRGMNSLVIGLIIPDIQNDFYASIAKIVADAATDQGFQLALSITEDNPERELKDLRAFIVSRAAGIIVTPTSTPRAETLALLQGVPAVQLVRQAPDIHKEVVAIDDEAAVRAATVHLINYGHRRIAYVGTTTEFSCGVDRLAGFDSAMRANGLDPGFAVVGLPRPEFAQHAVHRLMTLAEPPTGLVIGSSSLTIGALQALRSIRLSCPEDVSVVGYGDPDWFGLVGDGLTTISLPVQPMGNYLISLLLAKIKDKQPFESISQVASRFPASLTIRGSTKPLA